MSEQKYKYLGNKIIVIISVSFVILTSVLVFCIYSLFKNSTTKQIQDFTISSFSFFCKELDKTFMDMERIGNLYCEEISNAIVVGELKNEYDILTRILLLSNPDISEITVCLLPDTDYPNLLSYSYYRSNSSLIIMDELDTASIFFHTLLSNPMVSYPIEYQKKYWSDPYYSIFIPSAPIVGTLSIPIVNINEGQVYGVILLSFRMAYLSDIISKFHIGRNSYNILLGNYGNIGVHPLEKYLMLPTDYGFNIPFLDIVSKSDDISASDMQEQNQFDTLQIDSLGAFKCNNTFTLSYKLKNNWRFLTLFEQNLINKHHQSLITIFLLILALFSIMFFITMIVVVNKVLNNFKLLTNQLIHFEKYDLLDWKLSVINSNDDIEILTKAFNRLHKAYVNIQNRFTDQLIENSKLTYTERQIEDRIKYKLQEETEAWSNQNQFLMSSLNNTMEFVQLGKIICSTLHIENISQAIYEHLTSLIPVVFFGIYIYNEEKNTLDCEKGVLNGEIFPHFSLKIVEKNTIAVKCFDTNTPIAISNFDVEYRHYLLVNAYNPISVNCSSQYYATITNGDKVLGLFSIQCKEKGVFNDFNPEFLETLNTYLNMAIHNILNYRDLKKSLEKTKSVQNKLIQSERMASVGQLSAGIAHEIKNPLNFVINFSNLAETLVKDISEQMEFYKTQPNPEILEEIEGMIEDMKLNLSKIKEHGKRVDKIVKNMLVHSRTKSGEFALIDINNFVSEYSKLAYHGLRSIDPALNVTLTYNLDEKIEQVFVVPNNMSRVIINIVTNACFAAYSKLKQYDEIKVTNYSPEVTITTLDLDKNYIEIIIRDNGVGISEKNQPKIFTPFFTTKMAGEGTGLGLSICYEIVVQEHSGEISFKSQEGEYTEFLIKLPKKHQAEEDAI
jgi:signal transduction histidine kinase